MFFIFNAPNKVKENSNIFLFQFFIHCDVSYFGSVLWLKLKKVCKYNADADIEKT